MIDLLPWAVLGLVGATWLVLAAIAKPRVMLYVLFALAPTQFLFVPVSDFFLSPADVLVGAAALSLLVRLAALQRNTWLAVFQHRYLILMIGSYLAGFVVLNVFTRTLVRVPVALILSVLAVELLRTREHLWRAATAFVIAGAVDAGYGLLLVLLHGPAAGRFKGLSEINFAAMLMAVSAAIALAQLARTRQPLQLWRPAMLGAAAVATLSRMGVLAMLAGWLLVLRSFVSRSNKIRIVAVAALVVLLAVSITPIRERIVSRQAREIQMDGVLRNTADIRLALFQMAWEAFLRSPVFGLGYFQFQTYSNTDPEVFVPTGGQGYPTHNVFVEVLVEGGAIAFGLFMLHWAQYFRGLGPMLRRAVRERDALVAACLVGLPVVMVSALFANLLLVYSFWGICGLALACLNLLRREARQRTMPHVASGHGQQ